MVLSARHARPLGPAALLTALWAVVLWRGPLADARITDVFIYESYARLLDAGVAPYSDGFALEYPPLALVPIWLGRWLGGSAHYETAFGILMGVAALGCLAVVQRLGGRRAAYLFALLPLAAGTMVRTHFDLVPVALLLAALAVLPARPVAGFALLGVAAMTKGFPAVVVPVAFAWLWGSGRRREALRGAAAFAAVCLAVSAPFLGDGYLDAYRYHLERPVQIESTPAAVLYALGGTTVTGTTETPDAYGSNGLVGGASETVEVLFSALLLLVLVALTALAARGGGRQHLLLCAAAAVTAYVALGKVLSPQYLIWLAPFAALLAVRGARAGAALLALAVVLTHVEFPWRYLALVQQDTGVRVLVAARDLVLVAALIATAAAAARSPRHAAAPAHSGPAPP